MKKRAISFVLPMYNESENIEETVRRISGLAREIADDYEIVVSDDASTDGCGDIVDRLARSDTHVRSVRLKENTKFGGVLNAGLKAASKEIIVYTDADLPAKEDDIKKALAMIETCDVVTGYSLVIKDASLKRIMISKLYNFVIRLVFDLHLRDINSGFKIYKKKVIDGMTLRSKSPFIDVEIFAEAIRKGFTIKQYGLIFELRTKGTSSISRMSVLVRTFWDMIVYKLSRNI